MGLYVSDFMVNVWFLNEIKENYMFFYKGGFYKKNLIRGWNFCNWLVLR